MSEFAFKLESVRALREQVEQQAREELARTLARKAEREQALAAAEERLRDARAASQLAEGATTTAHDLRALQAYLERRERERLAALSDVRAREQEVGASRSRLQQAALEHAVLERLKQRLADEHRRAQARAEEAALGEIGLNSHRRASVEGGA